MAYLDTIYTGLRIFKDAATNRVIDKGKDSDVKVLVDGGVICVDGIDPEDLTPGQLKKLDMMGWTMRTVAPEECRESTVEWRRTC